MTISVLQDRQVSNGGTSVSSIALAFSSNLTAGSALHGLGTHVGSDSPTIAYTDNNSNTWGSGTLDLANDTVGGIKTFHQTSQNLNSGACTVTITFTGTPPSFASIWIREIGGAASTGNPSGHNGVFSSSTTSQAISATNTSNPALISVLSCNSNTQEVPSLDASLTASSANPGWNFGGGISSTVAGHKRITTTASQTVTNTQASADALVSVMAIFLEAGGGGGLTLALTGQAATFTAGTLPPSNSKPLLGQAGTSAAGTLVPSTSKALLGSSGTFSLGTLIPSTTIGLTGASSTFTAGVVTVAGSGNVTVALIGQASAFAQGALGVSISVPLLGLGSTSATGTMVMGSSPTLVGASSQFSGGVLTPASSVGLSGSVLSATPGTMLPGMSFSVSGILANFSLGILNPSSTIPLNGISQPTLAGQVAPSGGSSIVTQVASMLLIRRGIKKGR